MSGNLSTSQMGELTALIDSLHDERIAPEDAARLDRWIRDDESARWVYVQYANVLAALSWDHGEGRQAGSSDQDRSLASPNPVPPAPAFGILDRSASDATHYLFPQSMLFSYAIAAVLIGLGLLTASLVYVSQPAKIVGPSAPVRTLNPELPASDSSPIVGRITGMADCVWGSGATDQKSELINHKSPLRLGHRLALRSGLLEITYDTGAKVILQGPVTYEIESPAGGYLSLGKLTARLDKKSEIRGQKSDAASQKSEIRNQNSPDLCPLTSDLFAIRTPTAIVTDLGTEFGVEVDEHGETTSHVFRGSIRIQLSTTDGKAEGTGRVLRENESASTDVTGAHRTIRVGQSTETARFIRKLPELTTRILDLVDVVAGGNGFSGRRHGGIDPATGRATDTPPSPREAWFEGDRKYHRVETLPLVDGVFIPDGRTGEVQVDSAGHTFADFPKTNNATACHIWAGGTIPMDFSYPALTVLDGVDYALEGHGVLFLHANKGITFDLEAIRKANADWEPIRFLAMAGNTEKGSEKGNFVAADVWVLVDGQVRYRRHDLNGYSGAFPIAVPIGKHERYLTLAVTARGNGIGYDWIVLGDPRLRLRPTKGGSTQNATGH